MAKSVIFDEHKAGNLYFDYVEDGDATAIAKFIQECTPLAECVASDLTHDWELRKELVQEGMIKTYSIIREDKYNEERSSLYNFLSAVLHNCMVEILRSTRHRQELAAEEFTEDTVDKVDIFTGFNQALIGYHRHADGTYLNGASDKQMLAWVEECKDFAISRFPSLHYTVAEDVAQYVTDTIMEAVNKQSRGATSTILSVYSLKSRNQANVVLWSITNLFRMLVLHRPVDTSAVISLVLEHTEWTTLPDLALHMPVDNIKWLCYGLGGAYIKAGIPSSRLDYKLPQ